MLNPSFAAGPQLIKIQKEDSKNKHPNKCLALVVLTEPTIYFSIIINSQPGV
jgi:hypothetical protein